MLIDIVKKGSVDRSVCLSIKDSTDGTPETGVVFNTAGIDLWYRREGAAVTSITEVTLAALTTAHTDGGFLAVSHGQYRLDLPDAAFATGANSVDIGGTVTGMIVTGGRVRLVDYDIELGTGGSLASQGIGASGTLSGTHSSTTADLGTNAPTQDITGQTLFFPAHNLSRLVESYNTGTGVATVAAVVVTLVNGNAWYLFPTAPPSGGLDAAAVRSAVGLASANLDTQIAAVQADTDNLQTRIPAALVSGRIDASVGAMAANVLTATAIATDAFTAAKIAADVTTELQTGLATTAGLASTASSLASQITTMQGFVDTEVAAILAAVDTEVATIKAATDKLATALELDGAVYRFTVNALEQAPSGTGASAASIRAELDSSSTQLAAIRAKTDQFAFTSANKVDARVARVGNTDIVPAGTGGQGYGG